MATVEVSHKAAGVRSSSKIIESYVASLPGLPPHHRFQYTLTALSRPPALPQDIYRSLAKGFPGVHRFSAMTSHKGLIAFQKCDGHTHIYIQHLLPSLATIRVPIPRAKVLCNKMYSFIDSEFMNCLAGCLFAVGQCS